MESSNSTSKDEKYVVYKRAIVEVSKEIIEDIGYGHRENVYQKSMEVGLRDLGFKVDRKVVMSIKFHGVEVSHCILDILLNEEFILEIKADRDIFRKYIGQTEKYLRQRNLDKGGIINFNSSKKCVQYQWYNKKWLIDSKKIENEKLRRKLIIIEEDEEDIFEDFEKYMKEKKEEEEEDYFDLD